MNKKTYVPRMLMIGSAGRNAGKTLFACSVIRKFSRAANVTGVKVTTIRRKDGTCPRGGRGCGVCSSLKGNYCITDERDAPPGKDTARLLAAGARRVFWLRALKTHLREGLTALLERISRNSIIVCESNSLRTVVQPGLFLIVKHGSSDRCKDSAATVREFTDRIVVFDGSRFDLAPDKLRIANGAWALREQASAVILAGGASRRMGRDKAVLPVCGQPLIKRICDQLHPHFKEVIVSAGDSRKYRFPGVRTVPDRAGGQGPLMGLASALEKSDSELNFVTACDIPEINMPLVRHMLSLADGWDVVVPRKGRLLEPLFAVYRKTIAKTARRLLLKGERRVRALFAHCRVKYFDLPASWAPHNLNTMDEYRSYMEKS